MDQYLGRYAEPDARSIAERFTNRCSSTYRHAVVVPAFDEAPDCLEQVFARLDVTTSALLVIAVINVTDAASDDAVARTRESLRCLRADADAHTLLVDRVNQPLPRRQGVGAARKLGTDIATALYRNGALSSPWIYQTDADVCLPENYLMAPLPDRGAVVFHHRHHAERASIQHAADLYDLHIAYYVAGLAYCGSRYAYPTLGSTLVIHAEDYATVRGFPKRNAGEDFYLLNKLVKIAPVTVCRDVVVDIQARPSNRVPFGTGPALQSIESGLCAAPDGRAFTSYNWQCFELLADALNALEDFAERPRALSGASAALLDQVGFARVAKAIASNYTQAPTRLRALNDWFDGLKSLRFMHEARRYHADQPLLDALRKFPPNVRDALTVPDWV